LFQLENFKRVFLKFAPVAFNLFFHGSLQYARLDMQKGPPKSWIIALENRVFAIIGLF